MWFCDFFRFLLLKKLIVGFSCQFRAVSVGCCRSKYFTDYWKEKKGFDIIDFCWVENYGSYETKFQFQKKIENKCILPIYSKFFGLGLNFFGLKNLQELSSINLLFLWTIFCIDAPPAHVLFMPYVFVDVLSFRLLLIRFSVFIDWLNPLTRFNGSESDLILKRV